jgi:hypothetical protein
MIAGKGVDQPVVDHRVDQAEIAHLGAAADILGVRRQAHALLAAGHHHGRVPGDDRLGGDTDRAKPGAADLVQPPGRHFLRDAGIHARLAGRVLPLSGSQHLAEDHFRHVFRRDSGLGERGLDRDPAELVRGRGGIGAEECADGRALGGGDDDFGHGGISLIWSRP